MAKAHERKEREPELDRTRDTPPCPVFWRRSSTHPDFEELCLDNGGALEIIALRTRNTSLDPAAILARCQALESTFRSSKITTREGLRVNGRVELSARKSLELPGADFPEASRQLESYLAANREFFGATFGARVARWTDVETRVLGYHDGSFLCPHTDHSPMIRRVRLLVFVFIVMREPAGFTGGELTFHDPLGNEIARIPNENGTLILFEPGLRHSVSTVRQLRPGFENGRFVLTGWAVQERSPLQRFWTATKAALRPYKNSPGMSAVYCTLERLRTRRRD